MATSALPVLTYPNVRSAPVLEITIFSTFQRILGQTRPLIFAASLSLQAGLAFAQEAEPQTAQEQSQTGALFQVEGLAVDDLLNIRAAAGPGAMVIARLPNGSLLKNLGCNTVNGNLWCKVADTENTSLSGWTPGRYLREVAAAGEELAETPSAAVQVDDMATGNIPCARYAGQPMGNCEAAIVRGDEGEASVTITWPEGGARIIRFKAGKPEGSDSPDELKFTHEEGLNTIRIGKERFEITDKLAFGT